MQAFLRLIPQAIAWAEVQSREAWLAGTPLDPLQRDTAVTVGVKHPEKVRICSVRVMPEPHDPNLRQAANALGLLSPNTVGLTLGYAILGVPRGFNQRVLSHELRHVAQFEQAGSIAGFLEDYVHQVIQFGYRDAPYEVDARAHEQGNR